MAPAWPRGSDCVSEQAKRDWERRFPKPCVAGSIPARGAEFYLIRALRRAVFGRSLDGCPTDRKPEGTDIPRSKQVAPNIVAPSVSAWTDVAEHWDECSLDSWVTLDGERTHYQSASVSEFWTPPEMVAGVQGRVPDDTPRLFVSGTVVSLGHSLIYGDTWELALHDPVLNRTISHTYNVVVLGSGVTN